MKRLHVFSGPSLTPVELQQLSLECVWHPPARRGDLLRAGLNAGDWLVLIDGYYGTVPATPHAELIELLARGMCVVGCSSMGALRAAELHSLGMLGMGAVFEAYRQGLVTGDDEVAVMHDPVSFEVLSVPLINVRLGLWRWVQSGRVRYESVANALRELSGMPFSARTGTYVEEVLVRHDIPNADAILEGESDFKRLDARQTVRTLSAYLTGQVPRPTVFRRALVRGIEGDHQGEFN